MSLNPGREQTHRKPRRGARTRQRGSMNVAETYQEQYEHNMRILRLIRDDPGWALSRILLAERLEAELRDHPVPAEGSDGSSC